MKNVNRKSKPESLVNYASTWKDLLLKAKDEGKSFDYLLNNYRKDDIRETLEKMYSDDYGCYCCYCEGQIDEVSFEQIEHRKPKSIYPEYAFDWDNLHLACQKCNTNKRDKWNEVNEILDAVLDPIKDHLGYEVDFHGVYRLTLSNRGITTVEHADLNRASLLKGRTRVYQETMKAVDNIRSLGDDPRTYTDIRMLRDFVSGKYGSVIDWIINKELNNSEVLVK